MCQLALLGAKGLRADHNAETMILNDSHLHKRVKDYLEHFHASKQKKRHSGL